MNQTLMDRLTSRKLWAAIIGFVSAGVVLFTGNELDEGVSTQLVEFIPSFIALGYAFVQGIVDAAQQRAIAAEETVKYKAALGLALDNLRSQDG